MDPPTPDEPNLLAALRSEDPEAQRAFVEEHWAPLQGFLDDCVGLTEHDAAEITSEVLCEFLLDPAVFDPRQGTSLRTWLFVVAKNRARDLFRRRGRRPTHVELIPELRERDAPAAGTGPLAEAAQVLIHVCREVLDEEKQAMLWWRAYEVPYREIARWTGKSEVAARKAVSRARARIRRILAGLADELPELADPEVRRRLGWDDVSSGTDPS